MKLLNWKQGDKRVRREKDIKLLKGDKAKKMLKRKREI